MPAFTSDAAAGYLQCAPHKRYQLIGNCQSQTDAAVMARVCRIGLLERLENQMLFIRGNSNTGIAHRKMEANGII